MKLASKLYTMLLIGASVFSLHSVALAQGREEPELAPNPDDPPYYVTLSNKYIRFTLGVDGTYIDGAKHLYPVAGKWGVMTVEGDPETVADNNSWLNYEAAYPYSGSIDSAFAAFKIKVDDADPVIIGRTYAGWSISNPIRVIESPVIGRGKYGPYIEGEWAVTAGADGAAAPVTVKVNFSLVRDQVRMELTATNNDTVTKLIGFNAFADINLAGTDYNNFPYIPGVGLSRIIGRPDEYFGSHLSGNKLPGAIDWYDSLDNPVCVARNTLKGYDCVAPDYFTIGPYYYRLTWAPDGYTPSEVAIDDAMWQVTWKQTVVQPRASKKVVTYYGVGAATSAWTRRVGSRVERDTAVLAVQGPRSLNYDSTGIVADSQIKEKSFKIKAYVYNLDTDPGKYDLQNVSAYLYLPKGLKLAATSDPAQQEIGFVGINSEGPAVEWEVEPTGTVAGELEYYVAVKDPSGWQQVVSRKIMVPATKKFELRSGYQMICPPFSANNSSLEHLFGWGNIGYFAKYYDPSGYGAYQTVTNVAPSQAFWATVPTIRTGKSMVVDLSADAFILGEVSGRQLAMQYLDMKSGWNMVGVPYVYPMYLGQLIFHNMLTNEIASWDDAVAKGWVSRTVFCWNSYKSCYDTLRTSDSYLVPWNGYWFRTQAPITVVFRPSIYPGASVSTLSGGF